jgi:hypothetical protein
VAEKSVIAGEDEGRLGGQLGGCRGHDVRIGPRRLLLNRKRAPVVKAGDHGFFCHDNRFGGVYHR